MAYIGNNPELVVFNIGVEKFNGNSSCTQFQLSRTGYSDNNAIEVVVGGAQIRPTNDYGVNDGLLTFTPGYGAPTTGTQNILVTYRAPVVITFDKVNADQLVPGAITETAIGAGTITNTKYAADSITGDKLKNEGIIRANNIVAGAITGNLYGSQSVSGNNIGVGAISGNNLTLTSIGANNIVVGSLSGNLFQTKSISGNQLSIYSVSGNNIGIGAISANNFAGGGITSNVLSSNLTISTSRIAETVNVITTAISGNYSLYLANSTVYHAISNSAGHVTLNMIANSTYTLNQMLEVGQSVSVAIMLKHGSTKYRANVHVDGVLQTAYWAGNTQPSLQTSQSMSYEAYNFSIIKIASNEYTVFASNTIYGQANGQGMGVTVAPFGQGQ